ncbi:NAD-dependent epimerase/dehydratase family protein [Mesobacterium pallidum]|uniref:NAD-dependent epimerase/dehydratase family protein n=1 Tax=Mesobacterium pallidum TaxID=2872037 RepID=UPI001EE3739D|nr:NAD-dependent epimerase/dehydratase family protein [Mesobacterium pallidum]
MGNIRAGIIGAGYIATWHADAIRQTPGVDLAAVCDVSRGAAEGLAAGRGAEVFTDVAEMLASGKVDAVHILTPPHLHKALAVQCLEAGVHVLVEKPVATSAAEVAEMRAAAEEAGKLFAAGHNFLGVPAYERLKAMMLAGELGRINSAEITWAFPLAPLRSGPYGLWLLRETKNLLLELGPHLFAFAQDLFGEIEVQHLTLGKPVQLPAAGQRPQAWRVVARAGDVDITFNLQIVESFDDRSVVLRGSGGMARLDYAADALTVSRENASDLVVNPFRRQMADAGQHLREGFVNLGRQVKSLNRKSPYGLSFLGTFAAFYDGVRTGRLDARFDGASAEAVMRAIDDALALVGDGWDDPVHRPTRTPEPTALVIGGTGFIGRALTRKLVEQGRDVRVLSRGSHGPFADIADHVEVMSVSLRDAEGLRRAMEGIEVVYDLAKSLDKTWEDCLQNDVAVTERIAQAALDAGVQRFVYTGTIASYDMSDPSVMITESTGFAEDMTDRNLYARSKAECEKRLMVMHRDKGLPVVIARPGIVVGHGGPLQHWGIGRWHGASAVRIWGNGHNILPFVLIDDVAEALVTMATHENAVGQSFNLVGAPMLTARDYFDAIHRRLGARIRVAPGNLTVFWAADAVKSLLKKHALRRHGVIRPSLKDWKSRAHLSPFDNAQARQVLGWQPETDRDAFLRAAVDEAGLIGF